MLVIDFSIDDGASRLICHRSFDVDDGAFVETMMSMFELSLLICDNNRFGRC